MTAVIVGDDMNAGTIEEFGEVGVALGVLAHAVRDLEDADRFRRCGPAVTGDIEAVVACEREGLHQLLPSRVVRLLAIGIMAQIGGLSRRGIRIRAYR